jgi:hypothetical protein
MVGPTNNPKAISSKTKTIEKQITKKDEKERKQRQDLSFTFDSS